MQHASPRRVAQRVKNRVHLKSLKFNHTVKYSQDDRTVNHMVKYRAGFARRLSLSTRQSADRDYGIPRLSRKKCRGNECHRQLAKTGSMMRNHRKSKTPPVITGGILEPNAGFTDRP
jgi:hypothetical protein